jgi:hypothetical protein
LSARGERLTATQKAVTKNQDKIAVRAGQGLNRA